MRDHKRPSHRSLHTGLLSFPGIQKCLSTCSVDKHLQVSNTDETFISSHPGLEEKRMCLLSVFKATNLENRLGLCPSVLG